eukprot:TRINITY_DN2884_c0_g1_i1.p1 TRINITY_DN2884_c0_g1~~TRINITY_DN2884_c0_g1_i1.p1  ORF type:complete len:678 (+),score=75.22 TRINITY_DN2884_c0_g1_i1:73-2106(+)
MDGGLTHNQLVVFGNVRGRKVQAPIVIKGRTTSPSRGKKWIDIARKAELAQQHRVREQERNWARNRVQSAPAILRPKLHRTALQVTGHNTDQFCHDGELSLNILPTPLDSHWLRRSRTPSAGRRTPDPTAPSTIHLLETRRLVSRSRESQRPYNRASQPPSSPAEPADVEEFPVKIPDPPAFMLTARSEVSALSSDIAATGSTEALPPKQSTQWTQKATFYGSPQLHAQSTYRSVEDQLHEQPGDANDSGLTYSDSDDSIAMDREELEQLLAADHSSDDDEEVEHLRKHDPAAWRNMTRKVLRDTQPRGYRSSARSRSPSPTNSRSQSRYQSRSPSPTASQTTSPRVRGRSASVHFAESVKHSADDQLPAVRVQIPLAGEPVVQQRTRTRLSFSVPSLRAQHREMAFDIDDVPDPAPWGPRLGDAERVAKIIRQQQRLHQDLAGERMFDVPSAEPLLVISQPTIPPSASPSRRPATANAAISTSKQVASGRQIEPSFHFEFDSAELKRRREAFTRNTMSMVHMNLSHLKHSHICKEDVICRWRTEMDKKKQERELQKLLRAEALQAARPARVLPAPAVTVVPPPAPVDPLHTLDTRPFTRQQDEVSPIYKALHKTVNLDNVQITTLARVMDDHLSDEENNRPASRDTNLFKMPAHIRPMSASPSMQYEGIAGKYKHR